MGFGSDKTGFYKPSAVTVTASGNPLTLQNAKRLRKLTIYGNAVQDGTPSPDAPVEVQLCGDRTGNLWDRAYSDVDANWVGNQGGYRYLNLKLKENTTYTLFVKQNNMHEGYSDYWDSDDNVVVFCVGENPDPNTCNGNTVFGNTTTNNPKQVYSFTTTEAPYYFKLFIRNYNDITVKQVFDELLPGIMLVEGSYTADTLPAYEPYGYKVSGRTEGLNLWDRAYSDVDANWVGNRGGYRYLNLKLKENTTYTLFVKQNNMHEGYSDYWDSDNVATFYVGENPNTWEGNTAFGNTTNNNPKQVYSFTTTEAPYYFNLFIRNYNDRTVKQVFDELLPGIMLVQGSYTAETMPPYEPYQPPQDFAVYLPEQIAKVGDVADEVVVDMEKKTAELRKNVRSEAFTGGEDWYTTREPTDTQCYYVVDLTSKKVNAALSSLSSHFVPTTAITLALNEAKVQSFVNGTAWYGACVDAAVYPDVASFKQFVTEQYSEGNPLTVYHAIEPVTTDITSLQQWDAMPQVSGTATLTLSAEVEPSGAEAVYTATKRPKQLAHGADAVR